MKRLFLQCAQLLCATVALCTGLSFPHTLVAQTTAATADSSMLRGMVVNAETGAPLGYALLSIASLQQDIFANAKGRFYFPKLPNGTYVMRVRQLGYAPMNVSVTVSGTAMQEITVQLHRLVTRLAAMNVSANFPCKITGRKSFQGNAQILGVFEQLEQNADRARVLAKKYPFVVETERRLESWNAAGIHLVNKVDTIAVDGADRSTYKPGNVVRRVQTGLFAWERMLVIPTLIDFADETFQKNHCFIARGVDTSGGHAYLRIDFTALSKLKTPDVEGSVFLDTGSYMLHHTEIRLSKVPVEVKGVDGLVVTTHFTELRTGLPIIAGMRGVTTLSPGADASFDSLVEEQAALQIRFLKQTPDGPATPPAASSPPH